MHTGGIETLILRLTNWLIENNHQVDLALVKAEGVLLEKLNTKVNVIQLPKFAPFSIKVIYKRLDVKYDFIYSLSPRTVWLGLLMSFQCKCQAAFGVYHINDYDRYSDAYNRFLFDNKVNDTCKFFMTPAIAKYHEKLFGRNLADSYIFPIPLVVHKLGYKTREAQEKSIKIVSIGRLTKFKYYNIYMLDVINNLLKKGYNIEYDIYGDGEQRKEILRKIKMLNLNKYIKLKGTIDYDKMNNALEDAKVFVGMGTAAMEAALAGVPTIVALIDGKEPKTHGFIHELPDYNSGEFIKKLPLYSVEDKIEELLKFSQEDYEKISEASCNKIKEQYAIEAIAKKLIDNIKISKFKNKEGALKIPLMFKLQSTLTVLEKDFADIRVYIIKKIKKAF